MLSKLLRLGEGRMVKRLKGVADYVNTLSDDVEKLSDAELRNKTVVFKDRVADGEDVDDLLPEAFAVAREAAWRVLNQKHFDVQIMGGAALHFGNVAEMKTGEGKTLTAVLPAYLNALSGKGVHIVTVNDYLAKRDAEWMGRVHRFLGLDVGVILSQMSPEQRRAAYAADITYGTNNEFGFDYLRDNMALRLEDCVQRGHHFAIVDEVDSILIDEARTPLIISGPADGGSNWYTEFARLAPLMEKDVHYEVDIKKRVVGVHELGVEFVEDQLGIDNLYEAANSPLISYLNNAIKAKELFERDKHYIVRNGDVLIVDDFTGRVLMGRRYNEGLHQAIEAKEHVEIKAENQTVATITLQNYFRLYDKLAGMTGTAETEAAELHEIYKLGVVPIPTNRPMVRADQSDLIYKTEEAKFIAVVDDVSERYEKGQPVLIGTTSVERSEFLSRQFQKRRIPHNVLNAKYHEQEAGIIAEAGRLGAVTVATNMAGRGTDVVLGGNVDFLLDRRLRQRGLDPIETADEYEAAWHEELPHVKAEVAAEAKDVRAAGGLYVLGTERHESRRIDNQLRGRSGRQGDPGRSKFFLSLQDDLMRIFGSDRMDGMLQKLGLKEGEAIVHPWINRALAKAQQKVEARNFDIRKNLLKFDDVMNDQRKVVFDQRIELMDGEAIAETVTDMRHDVIESLVSRHIPEKAYPEQWDTEGLQAEVRQVLNLDLPVVAWAQEEGIADEEVIERLKKEADQAMARKVGQYSPDIMRQVEKAVLLQTLDHLWREHLANLDHLRSVIGFRGYAQRDPLQEYKTEAFTLFESMLTNLRQATTAQLMRVELVQEQPPQLPGDEDLPEMQASHINPQTGENEFETAGAQPATGGPRDPQDPSTWGKVGRNEACPCGSGKKYKHCHGALA